MAEWVWLHLMQVVEPLGHAHSHLHSTHPVRPRSARLLSPGKLVLKGEEGQRKGGAGRGRAGRGRGGERERRGEGGAREREGRGEGGVGRGRGQGERGGEREGPGRERSGEREGPGEDRHTRKTTQYPIHMHAHTHLPSPPSSALTSRAARDFPSTNCDTKNACWVGPCLMKPHTRTKLGWSQAHNRGTTSKLT